MNETPKENTPPLSMLPAVSGASELRCVEPIFGKQVNGAEIKLGMQTPRDIPLHTERLVVDGRLIFRETTPVLTKALQECAPPRDR